MKIGVSSYSFSQLMGQNGFNQLSAVKKAAELGFDNIEFTDLLPPDGVSVADFAVQLRECAKENNIEISAYAVGANLAGDDNAKEVARLKICVDIAHVLGAPFLRHDVMSNYKTYRSFDAALPDIAAACREVTEYAQTLNVRTMTENHGFICQDADRIERLVYAVNHENFGTLTDMGNFMCADQNPADSVSRVAHLAFLVHAKDFLKIPFAAYNGEDHYFETRGANRLCGAALGDGVVPVAQCVRILKNAGFNGYIDIEYEGPNDCIAALKQGLHFLKKLI